MVKEERLINIKCPMCGTILVTVDMGKAVAGQFQHKCALCKRFWRIDYKEKTVTHVKGKANKTPIKKWMLDLKTGDSKPQIQTKLY